MAAKAIYKRVVQDQEGNIVPSVEFTVIDEVSGLGLTIYSDRLGTIILTPPYFADVNGKIEFFVDPGTTFRVSGTGPTGSFTDRWVDGVLLGDDSGNVPTITLLGTAALINTGSMPAEIPTNAIADQLRIKYINSQADLDGYTGVVYGQQVSMRGFHPDSDVGGGMWYWKSDEPKANHKGGTVRSPTVPFVGATLADFLDGVGETDPAGSGCWVRLLDDSTVNVKWFGAKGDNSANDTIPVIGAVSVAAAIKGAVYAPTGNYILTESIEIPDNSVSRIFGDGPDNTRLRFNCIGSHLVIKSYYTRATVIEQLTVFDDTPIATSDGNIGVDVNDGRWGIAAHIQNANIINYTGTALRILSGYSYSAAGVEIRGRSITPRRGKAVVLDGQVGENFGGGGFFRNCVLHVHKIGVQNLFHSSVGFYTCTFESLSLFLNLKQPVGVSLFMHFENNWFELVDKGIINAAIDESALTALSPIQNKAEISRITFNSSILSGTTQWTTFLDSTVEPYYSANFSPNAGISLVDEKNIRTLTVSRSFPAAALFVQNEDMSALNFTPNNAYRKGCYTIAVEATDSAGNKMYAMYASDGAMTYLVGDIQDPNNIGTTVKINFTWSDALNLAFRVYATDLTSVVARITFTEY